MWSHFIFHLPFFSHYIVILWFLSHFPAHIDISKLKWIFFSTYLCAELRILSEGEPGIPCLAGGAARAFAL